MRRQIAVGLRSCANLDSVFELLAVRPTPQVLTVQDLLAPDAPLYNRSEVHRLNPKKVAIV